MDLNKRILELQRGIKKMEAAQEVGMLLEDPDRIIFNHYTADVLSVLHGKIRLIQRSMDEQGNELDAIWGGGE